MKIKRVVKKSSWLVSQLVSMTACEARTSGGISVNPGDTIIIEIKKSRKPHD